MRFAERCSALVPLLRNGANHGFASAPKAKQKRARRLFFVWYSRWESNPERPLRRGLLYPFNYGSISYYPAGNTSSLRSSCHRKRWGEPGIAISAFMRSISYYPAWEYVVAALLVPPQAVGLSSEGGLLKFGNPWNVLYFTTFRAKRQLFSRGKFESAPAPPRSRFLSKNVIQTLDNEARIYIIN